MWGEGANQVSLSSDFFGSEIVAHELFHALGLSHEHQRPDSDQNVTIHFRNIWPGKNKLRNKVSNLGINSKD